MKTASLLLLLCVSSLTYGQYEPNFALFWNNNSIHNPGQTGIENDFYGAINGRNQWPGFQNNPVSLSAQFEAKVDQIKGGLALNYVFDTYANIKSNEIGINYAYHLPVFNDAFTLGIGAGASLQNIFLDASWYRAIDPNDPLIPSNNISNTFLNLNGGLFLHGKKLDIGFSSTNFNRSVPPYPSPNRSFYFYSQYQIDLSPKFILRPIMQVVIYPNIYSTSIGESIVANVEFNNMFFLGVGYNGNAMYNVGFKYNDKFKLMYSYDSNLDFGGFYNWSSHEIGLSLMLNKDDADPNSDVIID